MNIVSTDNHGNVNINEKAAPPMRVEYIHPKDGEYMSILHEMNTRDGTGKLIKLIKWATMSGVELRIKPLSY